LKKNRKHNKASNQGSTPDLHGSVMCLHPREMATHHHHIDHEEITSSIQAAASLISLDFSFQNLSQSPSSPFLLNSLFFSSAKNPLMNNMIKYIYTLVASSRNKGYTLMPRPIQL